jgi:dephospho-CoA kinase
MKHLEAKGHTHVTMVVGSDRVKEFHGLLSKYRAKEFPGIKKVNVVSAGDRDPDAEGAEGMSASKLRGLVSAGKKDEFVSHYSDKKLGAHIHDKVKAGMQMESVSPVGIFLLGGPGSGKDYVLKNIFSRFDLTEVQADQILNGAAAELYESKQHIVINGANDADKIEMIQNVLEGYTFDFVHVSVTNKVSRLRNEQREQPIAESKRIDKFLKAEELAKDVEAFIFNNSINLNESSEMEKVFFGAQIEKLLERVVELGLEIKTTPESKTFTVIKEKYFPAVAKHKSGLPKKYVGKLSDATAAARKAHWKKMGKLSDSDPRAYEPAPGDKTSKTKPSKHTLAVRKMMAKEEIVVEKADSSLAAKAEKSGISVGTLRKVYNRGVAAWNSGHRPGTTPQQWGHARVNSYINKGKTYHTADKDLREELNSMFETEFNLVCCPESELHEAVDTVDSTPTLTLKKIRKKMTPGELRSAELDGLPVATSLQYESTATLEEAVQYHLDNKISFTENVFRPGSEMFFEMISEAKRLYTEGKYQPKDEWEKDMLKSNIGEIAEFEGQQVVLDYPVEEGLEEACWSGYTQRGMKKKGDKMVPNCVPVNEEDKTNGKGIGKPWQEGGGGAVYVRVGDGVRKISFSKSGMKKKYMDPAATRSFVARHHCLTNKDKTSASYWACRWPRFFSNSGKTWW